MLKEIKKLKNETASTNITANLLEIYIGDTKFYIHIDHIFSKNMIAELFKADLDASTSYVRTLPKFVDIINKIIDKTVDELKPSTIAEIIKSIDLDSCDSSYDEVDRICALEDAINMTFEDNFIDIKSSLNECLKTNNYNSFFIDLFSDNFPVELSHIKNKKNHFLLKKIYDYSPAHFNRNFEITVIDENTFILKIKDLITEKTISFKYTIKEERNTELTNWIYKYKLMYNL